MEDGELLTERQENLTNYYEFKKNQLEHTCNSNSEHNWNCCDAIRVFSKNYEYDEENVFMDNEK